MSGLQTQDFSSALRLTKAAPIEQQPTVTTSTETKPKKKICCACPDTKKLRDECVVEHGESACSKWIEAHRVCLRAEGFNGANDVMLKYRNFKKFDIVEGYSDHYYSKSSSGTMQSSLAKKIQEEWMILKKNLPDMIFVRVYELRMDLLRAVIVGAEGTPYHDGLFFFDVFFPINYPHVPPSVYYHSGGLRLNPNLYDTGYVCLSLLNTWFGTTNERWKPGVSNMLQVLVSIQGLILNAKPFYNEPGYGLFRVLFIGETLSMHYNEQTLILSLKTMVYTMKKPPKHFEGLVIGHFRDHAHDILTRCEAYYTKGIGVNCSFDGGKKKCSQQFKQNVEEYMKTFVGAFKQIGAEDVEEFLSPTRILTLKSLKKERKNKSLIQMIRDFFGL